MAVNRKMRINCPRRSSCMFQLTKGSVLVVKLCHDRVFNTANLHMSLKIMENQTQREIKGAMTLSMLKEDKYPFPVYLPANTVGTCNYGKLKNAEDHRLRSTEDVQCMQMINKYIICTHFELRERDEYRGLRWMNTRFIHWIKFPLFFRIGIIEWAADEVPSLDSYDESQRCWARPSDEATADYFLKRNAMIQKKI